jgi:hypothetical protein
MSISLKKKLINIYNANQCVDLNDCDIAISQTKELILLHGYTPALIKRLLSLENKRKCYIG